MTISRSLAVLLGAGAVALCSAACGTAPGESGFESAKQANGKGTNANGDQNLASDGDAGGSAANFGNAVDAGGLDAACATSSTSAANIPVFLIFMFDQSGSMNDNAKWTSCRAGLEGFFGDPSSAGLNASLTFFPQQNNTCAANSYATPLATMRPLPDAATFKTYLDQVKPNGNTPHLPAVQGAISYAQTVQAQNGRDAKTAIVLVTDGDPNGCGTTVQNVAAELAKVRDTIPTYVIGVGPETTNLNKFAVGGGTTAAIIVQTNSPAQITADFEKAINQIKAQTLSCEYAMGKPANGQTLDVGAVNVVFTPTHGSGPMTLTYNKDCGGGDGWHYDDATNPTKIEICPTSCTGLKAEAGGKVDIVFGCKTQGGIPAN